MRKTLAGTLLKAGNALIGNDWAISGRGYQTQFALNRILDAYNDAITKHPDAAWPKDIIHMTAIMMEEAGEAMQAANNVVHEDASLEPLRTELAQTAAMCLRCLINLEDRA